MQHHICAKHPEAYMLALDDDHKTCQLADVHFVTSLTVWRHQSLLAAGASAALNMLAAVLVCNLTTTNRQHVFDDVIMWGPGWMGL